MSQENVEVARRVLEAERRGDIAAVFDLYDDDIEWDVSRVGGPMAGGHTRLKGHEGVRTWLRTWYQGFGEVEYEVRELLDAGDDVVLVIRQHGRGRSSGADVTMDLFGVWTVRGGKVTRAVWFPTRDEALESVGLA